MNARRASRFPGFLASFLALSRVSEVRRDVSGRIVRRMFSPVSAAIGGALIGVSASALLLFDGRIAGISGIVGRIPSARPGDRAWRVLFVLGLLAGGLLAMIVAPDSLDTTLHRPLPVLVVAGLLVGFGTRLGNGCTSGHGVCGLSRFSKRSLVAVVVFMATGALGAIAGHLAFGAA